jgi:hypothetical protein
MVRIALGAIASFIAIALPSLATAGKLDLNTPEGANAALRKIQCSLKDQVPTTYYWLGEAFGRVPGEPDRKLFKVEGMNIRQCVTVDDPARGKGWRLITKELLIYFDPKTGEPLTTWNNPYTGKTNTVLQTANDPVNQPPSFPVRRDGSKVTWPGVTNGNQWWMTITVPLFYDNPLQGAYQKYVGGKYHATEMFNFMGTVADLVDDKNDIREARVGWVRIASWLPWMEMGDKAGLMYIHAAGRKLDRFEDLSASLKAVIDKDFPQWKAPPPANDTRPNETSWTYFKDKVAPEQGKGH